MEVNSSVVLQLMAALRECAKHVQRGVADQPLDEVDVGLLTLAGTEKGGLKPSQAAAMLEVAFPSVTRHVRALQDKGLITIAPDTDDGRSYAISLSPTGEQALRAYRDNLVARFTPAVTDWSAAELAALTTQVTRLAESMSSAQSTATTRRTPTAAIWWRTN
ncbi:MarR family winged helix-turn-helix transcriptional regulator [Actinophytocola glycyrrhizae]|uniref:MarR family winged helix-turn-helix transcriptional regulator n=1 Tax=Actinophytocola glycyrrhizae TaxID=2044873 RepID=A0ABV9S5M4_9PSEU